MRRLTLCIVAILLCAGCLTPRQSTPALRYVIAPKVEVAAAESCGKSLALRPLEPARPYKQNVVYRRGDELGVYTSVEWAELPSDAATRALADALIASHRFTDVANAVDLAKPELILTGQLRRFDLIRDGDAWAAVCELRLELRQGLERSLVWSSTLSATEPLAKADLSALPAAMNTALGRIVGQAVTEIVAK